MSSTNAVSRKRSLSVRVVARNAGAAIAAAFLLSASLPLIGDVRAQSPVTISVDAAADVHPISPLIYGVAYGDSAALSDLNCPINRYGGNNASRYNWQLNAD
ncbi:MAG TPA: hypothetical protein VEZ90_09035, partial [Blastocatellia bacterium]|nr:hypothetical protein [Blastocatellia bacterium]